MPLMAIRFKVFDENGRTVCKISKTTYFDERMEPERTEAWAAQARPISEKELAREEFVPAQKGRLAQPRARTVKGQRYLELPGLTLKWEKVESALNQVAYALGLIDASGAVLKDDMAAATLTVEQLRKFAYPFPPEGPKRRDYRCQSGLRDEGQCGEGHRGDQGTRVRRHGGRQNRVARSASS